MPEYPASKSRNNFLTKTKILFAECITALLWKMYFHDQHHHLIQPKTPIYNQTIRTLTAYEEHLSISSISPSCWSERPEESGCSCLPFDFGDRISHDQTKKEPYHELGGDYFDKRRSEATAKRLVSYK